MPYTLDDKLVVGITSRALFDLRESDAIFQAEGLEAYRAHQLEHEDETLPPGTGFPLVRALLKINDRAKDHLVEVIILSRNDGDSGLRLMRSVSAHGLDITRGAFRGGEDPTDYLGAFHCDVFLSAEPKDVEEALRRKTPAALVLPPPEALDDEHVDQVRIAFDGDAVLFDAESERFYQREGLEAFLEREKRLANQPMAAGPFKPFLLSLGRIQQRFPERDSPIRTALVTARNAPADERVIKTFRAWNVRVDETVFLGGIEKAEILAQMRPHIFFDDQLIHLERARERVPSAHVLSPVVQPELDLYATGELADREGIESGAEHSAHVESEAEVSTSRPVAASDNDNEGASVTRLRPPQQDAG